MSVLTLVRHGQAAYMDTDYDKLSRLGEEQAKRLGSFWCRHRIAFDRVYHGPAKRHIRTMEIAADTVRNEGIPWPEPQLLPALDEFDAFTVLKVMIPVLSDHDEIVRELYAEFRANQTGPEAGRLLQKLFEAVARHWSSGHFDVPGIESWGEFRARVAGAIDQLRASAPRSSQTVAFTSAGPIAVTLAHVLDLSPRKAVEFVWLARNSSYSQFLFSGERFTLHAFNAVPHIDDLAMLTYR